MSVLGKHLDFARLRRKTNFKFGSLASLSTGCTGTDAAMATEFGELETGVIEVKTTPENNMVSR